MRNITDILYEEGGDYSNLTKFKGLGAITHGHLFPDALR